MPVLCAANVSAAAQPDTSSMSVCSDEGLDVSQQFAETVFTGSSLDSDAEEIVSGLNYHSLSLQLSILQLTANDRSPVLVKSLHFRAVRPLRSSVRSSAHLVTMISREWLERSQRNLQEIFTSPY